MPVINLDFRNFLTKRNVVLEEILDHRNIAECKDCTWIISVVGFQSLTAIEGIENDCQLRINMELDLLGSVVETLVADHGFTEDRTYKPDILRYKGALLIYCQEH